MQAVTNEAEQGGWPYTGDDPISGGIGLAAVTPAVLLEIGHSTLAFRHGIGELFG